MRTVNRKAVLSADDTRMSVLRWTRRFLLVASLLASVSSILPAQSLTLVSAGTPGEQQYSSESLPEYIRHPAGGTPVRVQLFRQCDYEFFGVWRAGFNRTSEIALLRRERGELHLRGCGDQ